jgi:hypothetical protein
VTVGFVLLVQKGVLLLKTIMPQNTQSFLFFKATERKYYVRTCYITCKKQIVSSAVASCVPIDRLQRRYYARFFIQLIFVRLLTIRQTCATTFAQLRRCSLRQFKNKPNLITVFFKKQQLLIYDNVK